MVNKRIKLVLKNPALLIISVLCLKPFRWIPDDFFLKIAYWCRLRKKLNLSNPVTFNEKLQWLKLYNRNPEYTMMVDKYKVRDLISETIGKEYLIPLLGIWDKPEDIDWNLLPNQFVLKCNHDSGSVIICKDKRKFDKKAASQKLSKCLNENLFWRGREWPYKNVKPLIVAEQYLADGITDFSSVEKLDGIKDFKFMCFNGKVRCSFVCSERFSEEGLKVTFFDESWNVLPFERHYKKSNKLIERPTNYELMVSLSEKLALDIPFVRVDFYEVSGKIYFGELTFFPGSGFEEFRPESADYDLGKWLYLAKN